MKLSGNTRNGIFNGIVLLYFNGYKIQSYVQFNHRLKHFRTIKVNGERFGSMIEAKLESSQNMKMTIKPKLITEAIIFFNFAAKETE